MEITNCSRLREALIRRLNDDIEVASISGQCVFSLPIKSLDDRHTEVFIESMLGTAYRVHDGGMATSHLFAQGIHVTEYKAAIFEEIARRLGASYFRGVFETACDEAHLESAILAVGQCSAMATVEVAAHKPLVEEEPITIRVGRSLDSWRPDYIKQISKNFPLKGIRARHRYEFVSFPQEPRFNTVAVKILAPSHSAQAQAERYGFAVLDTEQLAPYQGWQRLAIVTKAETWGDEALRLVSDLSARTVPLVTGEEEKIEGVIPQIMRDLSEAA